MQAAAILENEALQVRVVPHQGGRITSLRSRSSGCEFLLQSERGSDVPHPGRHAEFTKSPCAGIDECLPTVSRCDLHGKPLPDHGDFWQLPWQPLDVSPQEITLRAEGFSLPLRFTRRLYLRGLSLCIDARIENTGSTEVPFLYATHPLLAIDAGDRIVLPSDITSLRLHSSHNHRLGDPGNIVSWPRAQATLDLSRIESPDATTAEMLYTPRLTQGWSGLYRTHPQQGITLHFDPRQLPYLGLWICCGGWPDKASDIPLQYAFAPEPTNAPCGSLAEAIECNLAPTLAPGSSFDFSLEFHISAPSLSFAEFLHTTTLQSHRRHHA